MVIAEPQSGWRGRKEKRRKMASANRNSEDYHGDEQTLR